MQPYEAVLINLVRILGQQNDRYKEEVTCGAENISGPYSTCLMTPDTGKIGTITGRGPCYIFSLTETRR